QADLGRLARGLEAVAAGGGVHGLHRHVVLLFAEAARAATRGLLAPGTCHLFRRRLCARAERGRRGRGAAVFAGLVIEPLLDERHRVVAGLHGLVDGLIVALARSLVLGRALGVFTFLHVVRAIGQRDDAQLVS